MRAPTRCLPQSMQDGVRVGGASEKITLGAVAACSPNRRQLLFGLDAFSDHAKREAVAKAHYAGEERGDGAGAQFCRESPVYLHLSHWHSLQLDEGGKTRSEVVDRKPGAQLTQLSEHGAEDDVVGDDLALGDFDCQERRRKACLVQGFLDL